MSTENKVTAKTAYQAFQSYQDRQQQILDSVVQEQDAVSRELETATEYLAGVLEETFAVGDLPLDVMTTASMLSENGAERNFHHLLTILKHKDEVILHRINEYEIQHGSLDELIEKRESVINEIESVASELEQLKDTLRDYHEEERMLFPRIEPLQQLQTYTGIVLTTELAKQHENFSFVKWLTDGTWKSVRYALKQYKENGGKDIDSDIKSFFSVEDGIARGVTESNEKASLKRNLDNEKGRLSKAITAIQSLKAEYKGEEKIHKELCANFADYLQEEAVASFVGQNLPQEKANPLMIATLKFRNLHVLYNNLEAIRGNAEKALNLLSEPVKNLKKLSSAHPQKMINVDLEDTDNRFTPFNNSANSTVARSNVTRKTLANFSPAQYSSSSYAPALATSSASTSDPFTIMNIYLYMTLADSLSANPACNFSGLSENIGTADIAGTLSSDSPDVSSLAMDNLSVEVPTLDIPTSEFQTGGGFGGGMSDSGSSSSSSYDSGSSYGGGSSSYDSGVSYSSGSSDFGGGGFGGGFDIKRAGTPDLINNGVATRRRTHNGLRNTI